jgi:hypothetical protein
LRYIFAFIFIPFFASAQSGLKYFLTPDTTKYTKLDWTINMDGRSSIANKKFVNIIGINSGIAYGKNRSEITLGYYWVNYNNKQRFIDLRRDRAKLVNVDYYTHTDLYYYNLMYFPYLKYSNRWRISLPVEIGIGTGNVTRNSLKDDILIWKKKDVFVPIQLGFYVEYKATRYIGFSLMAGYRQSLKAYRLSNEFSGPYYSYGFSFYTDAMGRDLKKWRLKRKEKK